MVLLEVSCAEYANKLCYILTPDIAPQLKAFYQPFVELYLKICID